MYGVPWSHYEAHLALRGEGSVPRMSFLEGALELMVPSWNHERVKSYMGRLIEAYALEVGIDFSPYGAWTLKSAPKEAGAEPDECYIVGPEQRKDAPDMAIEVIWTSGGLDKLEIYRRLGVAEVVFWREGRIEIQALGAQGYEAVRKSRFFPGLDFELLLSFMDRPTAAQAIRAFRDEIRGKMKTGRRARRPRR